MRNLIPTLPLLALAACSAPAIDDWPPTAPPVSDEVIQRYIDLYAKGKPVPVYGPEDIRALTIMLDRKARSSKAGDDITKLRQELDDNLAKMKATQPSLSPKGRSRAEINALKRKIKQKYDSRVEQRRELKTRYGEDWD